MRKLTRPFLLVTVLAGLLSAPVSSPRISRAKEVRHAEPVVIDATARADAPEDVGFSSQRLERIGTAIQKSIDDGRLAGAVSLVARPGHQVSHVFTRPGVFAYQCPFHAQMMKGVIRVVAGR